MKSRPPRQKPRASKPVAARAADALVNDLMRALDASKDAIVVVDASSSVIFANARAVEWFSEHAPLLGKPAPFPCSAESPAAFAVCGADGHAVHVERSLLSTTWAGGPATLATLRDISSLRAAEEHLRRLARLQNALGQTAAALARATSEQELLEDVCRIAVAFAGFRATWVGRVNATRDEVENVTVAGPAADAFRGLRISLDPSRPTGQGPIAQTLRLGVPYVCHDIAADTRVSFWVTTAQENAIGSLAICPLRSGGAIRSVLAFYARETGYFDPELLNILNQIAAEVSGGLERLNSREARLRAESALAESEARLRLLAGASRQVLWMREAPSGRLIYVSPAFEPIFGEPAEHYLGSTDAWLPLVHPEDQAAVRASMAIPPPGQGTTVLRYRILRSDGSVRWVEDEIIPIEDHGRVRYLSGSLVNITQRHEAERQLSLFRSLVETARDVFYIVRPAEDFRLVYMNEAGRQLFGWSMADLPHKRPWDWDANFSREACASLVGMLKTRGAAIYETTTRSADGRPVRVEVVSSLLQHGDGEYNVGYFRDVSARALAEAELRDSEERFHALFEEASDALFLIDPQTGRVTDCNGGAVALFDAEEKEQLVGLDAAQLQAAASTGAEEGDPARNRILNAGSWSGLVELRSLKGRRLWGAVASRHIDVGGRALHIVRITDTTENRRLVELLADTERLAHIGGWEYHVEEDRLAWTDGTYRIYGVAAGGKVTPAGMIGLHHPDHQSTVEEAMKEGLATGRPWTVEVPILRNGSEAWVRLHGAVELAGGRPRRMHGTINDITESRRTGQALREREERVREQALMLDEATDAIIACGLDRHVHVWNRGAERQLGWPREEALGRTTTDLHFPDEARFSEALTATREHGMWNGELEYRSRNGAIVLVESRWTLLNTPDGQPHSILTINTDITERKRREAGQLRAQRLESIGTLAGGIAHDLNNILAPVVLSADMLRMRISNPTDLDLINTIGVSARRGAAVVRQVLSFARGIEGTHVPLNLRHVLPEIRHIIAETFPRNITCRVEMPHDLWSIMAEPTQVHQALINVCVNSRDAMSQGGSLTLRAENVVVDEPLAAAYQAGHSGPHVRVEVIDTGSGISPETRERIFEPFFTTKGPGRGTGLGLSTAMAIVRSHQGFITVESTPGHGTRFALYFPAEQAAAEPPEPRRLPPAELPGHGETILVIDDEASIRGITRQSLEGAGYRVLTAEDGAAGITLFGEHRADVALVLTDLMMPVMDGLAVIRSLREIAPDLRIVAMSGASDAAELSVSLAPARDIGFLLKPFNLDTLIRAVHGALDPVER